METIAKRLRDSYCRSMTIHLICRVMIIDLDAHQGNGHEKDFGSDGKRLSVLLFSCVYFLSCYYFMSH